MSRLEEWEEWEQRALDAGDWLEREWRPELTEPPPFRDARINRARVTMYTKAVCNLAIKAEADFQKAFEAAERARKRAERAMKYRDRMLAHAEAVARCYSAADPQWDEEVAACLEELIG